MSLFSKKRIPVVLITGYLGSGKTTFLNNLLAFENRKIALVVNDMGKVNIDAKLIKNETMKKMDTKMIELSNGCICCTLRDEFMVEIENLAKIKNIDAIFVEASGISEPANIAQSFLAYEETNKKANFFLSRIITLVDADRINKEFLFDIQEHLNENETEAESLTSNSDKTEANKETSSNLKLRIDDNVDLDDDNTEDDPDIINLVMDQIEFCNCIVLNKCDLVSSEALLEVKNLIKKLQPEAEIIESIFAKVNYDRILNGASFDYDKAMNSSAIQRALKESVEGKKSEQDEYGIDSFVFEEKRPFVREKFMGFLEQNFPHEIIRSKGYIWFEDDPTHVQLVESAGRNASVMEYSNWVDAFSKEEKQQVFDLYPEVLEDWDEEYGDRLNQIVFIGLDYNREEIQKELEACIA
ncbi:CobW family GTP-binding protein [Lachnospira pectinoschiza]|uniref:GTPase, G3E family n=1 Tax=Lachnospira pectinoschiza TaxID=28052 RepID=A0A1G9W511_9FIRM|nr:GTP-binding protein [Lachnospira pectinoschiza]SDM79281.1 GTPase, G3E family [Lachnospira pectinoschiza]